MRRADSLVEELLTLQPRDLRTLQLSAKIRHDRMIVADSEQRDAEAIAHAGGAATRIESVLSNERATRAQREAMLHLYANVALAALNLCHYEEAVRYATRQVEQARALAMDPMDISLGLSVLANALRQQGHLNEALTVSREARDLADVTPTTDQRGRFNRFGPLLRDGLILGEDRAVSLERPTDAVMPLREAFEMQVAAARADPNDSTSRARAGTAGRELGDILRWHNPREAIAVYDGALGRLREIKDNVKARRDTALVLANSSHALRRLKGSPEALRRLDEALAILTATKDYPADRLSLDSDLYPVLMARADHQADEGHLAAAIEGYHELLAKVIRTKPDIEHVLKDANDLSLLWESLARLLRTAGAEKEAAAVDAQRTALWQHWNRTLPNNPFVARRLASPDRGPSARP